MYLVPTRRLDGKAILASSDFLNGSETYVTMLRLLWRPLANEWKSKGDVRWLMAPR